MPPGSGPVSYTHLDVYKRQRLYCSGGCAANAYHATGSIRGVYEPGCELFRKRMECAIMIQAARAQEGQA